MALYSYGTNIVIDLYIVMMLYTYGAIYLWSYVVMVYI